ncbi:MAG: methyltransferase domain-containing protein [Variibacter sp.]|nr:methyltransferase domain-containing protein [Variibacter sp.]
MGADLDNTTVEKAYARWAPVYDLVFDKVMAAGRRAAVEAAMRAGRRVLDVGVGTGLELRYFHDSAEVVGVDLSEPMLRKAQERIRAGGMRHIAGLCVMDAARLAFPDETFDAVIAPYVITVVPHPEASLDELIRVVRRGGDVVLVNHIGADRGPRAVLERWLARQTRHIGWRPEFPWSRIEAWCASRPHVELAERRAVPPFGLFTLVRLRKRRADMAPVPQAA